MAMYNDISTVLNNLNGQARGSEAITATDLTGLIAEARTSLSSTTNKDQFMGSLLTMCSKFWNRYLETRVKYPLMNINENEFGGMLVKNDIAPFIAKSNTSTETGGTLYTPDWTAYEAPTVEQSYYVGYDTWSEKMKLPDDLLYTAFHNENEFAGFINAIMAAFGDAQIQHTNKAQDMAVINFMSEVLNTAGASVINLRTAYNAASGESLTAEQCLTSQAFMQFAGAFIMKVKRYLSSADGTTLFNADGKVRRSDDSDIMALFLTDFVTGYKTYLLNGVNIFDTEFIKLGAYYEVDKWQATSATAGAFPDFATASAINVKNSKGHAVNASGIIGALIDRRAVATSQLNYNAATDRFNGDGITFYTQRAKAAYINDWSEQAALFTIA